MDVRERSQDPEAMILALDLGSAHLGVVLAPPSLPLRPAAATLRVDPADLGATVRSALGGIREAGITRVVIEHGKLYIPKGVSPAAAQKIGEAWGVCSRLHERLLVALADLDIPVDTISRASWAHRVVRRHGGITTAMAREGVRAHVDPAFLEALTDQHQIDACGALAWAVVPEHPRAKPAEHASGGDVPRQKRARVKKKISEEERARRRRIYARKARDARRVKNGTAERLSRCNCGPDGAPREGPGRHARWCAGAPPPAMRGLTPCGFERAARALDRMMGR